MLLEILCAWTSGWVSFLGTTHRLTSSIFRHFTRAGEILSREEPVYILPACRLSSFNQVGGEAGGPQYLLCEWCLISSVVSTLHMDSSCKETLPFSQQTGSSRVLPPPWGRCSPPEETEHLGSPCCLNRTRSCVSSSLLPLPPEIFMVPSLELLGGPRCFPIASLRFSVVKCHLYLLLPSW